LYGVGNPSADIAGTASRLVCWGGAAAMVVAGLSLSRSSLRSNILVDAAVLVGDSSYALYLLHSIVLVALRITLGPYLAGSYPLLYAAIQVVSCVAVAVIAYLWIERPLTRLLQNLIIPARREAVVS
jgi:exopolysaccharide production protein ExoZ